MNCLPSLQLHSPFSGLKIAKFVFLLKTTVYPRIPLQLQEGSMATKRPAGDDVPLPQAKKPLIGLPPLHVPAATSQEDLDIKVLQVRTTV